MSKEKTTPGLRRPYTERDQGTRLSRLTGLWEFLSKGAAGRLTPAIERYEVGRKVLRYLPVGREWVADFTTGGGVSNIRVRLREGTYNLDLRDDVERSLYYRSYERSELRTCLGLVASGDMVLDIGANVGAYGIPLAGRVGPEGSVHAFEPVPWVAERLRTNSRLSGCNEQLSVNEIALSDSADVVEMFVPSGRDGASPEMGGGYGSLERFEDLNPRPVLVKRMTLDEFVRDRRIDRVRFTKLDVEGHEMAVLRGGAAFFAQGGSDFLLVEGNERRLRSAGFSVAQLVDSASALGFQLRMAWPSIESGVFPEYCGNLLFRWVAREPVN
jgi:FkbM family methyltransferase